MLKYLLLFLIVVNVNCFGNRELVFSPPSTVSDALNRGVSLLNQFYNDEKQGFFAVVRNDAKTQIILCSDTQTHPAVKSLISKSRRFIVLNNKKVPFIYYFDTQSDQFKAQVNGYIQFGGYSIEFDGSHNIIKEGIIF